MSNSTFTFRLSARDVGWHHGELRLELDVENSSSESWALWIGHTRTGGDFEHGSSLRFGEPTAEFPDGQRAPDVMMPGSGPRGHAIVDTFAPGQRRTYHSTLRYDPASRRIGLRDEGVYYELAPGDANLVVRVVHQVVDDHYDSVDETDLHPRSWTGVLRSEVRRIALPTDALD